MKKRYALVTGGAGFIGSHTADALAKKGYKVKILDNLSPPVHTGRWPNYVLQKGFELIRGDVREKKMWEKALRGASCVYHLAAYQDQRLDFSTFFTTNTVSTALLYETIVERRFPVKKVVLASSQFVYGDGVYRCAHSESMFYPELRALIELKRKKWDILCPHGRPARSIPFREDQDVMPTNSYGLSKQALENCAMRLGKTYGIPTTAFRYSIVQGPRQSPRNLYSGALRIFVSQALAKVPITVYEDGMQTRDFVNIRDVVRANLLALTNRKTDFGIFNVGGGSAYRVLDFAKLVKKITASPSPIAIGAFRRTDTRHAVSDISKLKRLGWRPQHASAEAIRDYVRWFTEEGFDKRVDRRGLTALKKGIA
ncbi:MAG: NAD-dependent epimerase/dehydratase family protein [Candidatus Liptonbacteria bacterium]|nr:NAD-dependent epimerase/dehydratase family protein [Candidatus Liptonbacteria bacterium]